MTAPAPLDLADFPLPGERIFASPPPAALVCSICERAFTDPIQLECGHAFCRGCLVRRMRVWGCVCPVGRCKSSDGARPETMDTSVELKALVDDMPRRCRFGVRRVNIDSVEFWELDAAGCNEVLKIGEVWAHERVCDFVPVQCKFAGCGVWIRRCNVAAHNTAAAVQHAEGERAARLALERRCAAAQQRCVDAVRTDIMRSQRRLADKRRRQTDAAVLADMEAQEAAAENALREAERQEVMRSVDRDRRYSVDAAIVSIMKERRHVTHATLVLDVQTRLLCLFKPTAKLIKLRIEDMISRDYIERDADDHALYNYLA